MPITYDPEWEADARRSEKRRRKDKFYRAIEQHYRDSRSKLISLAYTSLHNHADAEEAVQDTYVNALKYYESYDSDATLHDWLLQILRNCISKKWADISKHGMVVEYVESRDNRAETASLLSRYQKAYVLEKIKELSNPTHKRIVKLYLFNDLDPKEISEQLPESVQNVKKIIVRFKESLRGESDG